MRGSFFSKKIRTGLFVLFSLIASSGMAFGKDTIKVGYFSLLPHIYGENGKHMGALIELWENYLAPAMDVQIVWVGPLPPVRAFEMLKMGEINVLALFAKNEERLKLYDWANESFFTMEAGLAVLKGNKLNRINSVDDIANFTIGFFKDGFIPPAMKQVAIKWDLVTEADWGRVNYEKLLAKRIDAAFDANSLSLESKAKQLKIEDKVRIIVVPNTKTEEYSAFCKKDNGRFLEKYDKATKTMNIKEKYLELLEKYM